MGKEEEKEETKEEESKPMEVEESEDEEEETVDFDGLDVFEVEDVNNVGGGMPLCKNFSQEDWAMMSLRHELHLLTHAFRKDVNDDERVGIHLDHIAFYYNKYYRKTISPNDYGVESFEELL